METPEKIRSDSTGKERGRHRRINIEKPMETSYKNSISIVRQEDSMTEKEAIELETAKQFINLYNSQMGTSFSIVKHSDAPDFHCQDKEGTELKFDVTLTEDHPGDIQGLLGRSDALSLEALKRHNEALERGKASIFEVASCLQDNVFQMAKNRIQSKINKMRYGPNTALVVRDTSGLRWSWETVLGDLASSLDLRNNPFDKGIWLFAFNSNQIFQIV
jgi:hypothetical protein